MAQFRVERNVSEPALRRGLCIVYYLSTLPYTYISFESIVLPIEARMSVLLTFLRDDSGMVTQCAKAKVPEGQEYVN